MNSKNSLSKPAQNADKKILFHACCAICSAYPVSYLKDVGYDVIVYFYNPNIYPEGEYLKRVEAQKTLCRHFGIEMIEEAYQSDEFYNCAKGLENEPERGKRCDKCFELRLNKTAEKAKDLGIKNFATSIVISPHKNFAKLSEIGKKIALQYELNFLDIDFKKKDGFLKTNQISKKMELYRQNYCGCEFSIRQ